MKLFDEEEVPIPYSIAETANPDDSLLHNVSMLMYLQYVNVYALYRSVGRVGGKMPGWLELILVTGALMQQHMYS